MEKVRIMLFDDDPMILELCESILIRRGYEVFTSLDCEDIISKVNTIHPDVIIMDNWIPAEGGIQATRALKKDPILNHIPVIFFTADANIRSLAESAGADTFLAKPFSIKDLESKIVSVQPLN